MSIKERLNKFENKVNLILNDFDSIKENINIITKNIENVNDVSLKLDNILNLIQNKENKI